VEGVLGKGLELWQMARNPTYRYVGFGLSCITEPLVLDFLHWPLVRDYAADTAMLFG